eukprot:354979-Chlamydomonas_euryale.AAC.3
MAGCQTWQRCRRMARRCDHAHAGQACTHAQAKTPAWLLLTLAACALARGRRHCSSAHRLHECRQQHVVRQHGASLAVRVVVTRPRPRPDQNRAGR